MDYRRTLEAFIYYAWHHGDYENTMAIAFHRVPGAKSLWTLVLGLYSAYTIGYDGIMMVNSGEVLGQWSLGRWASPLCLIAFAPLWCMVYTMVENLTNHGYVL